MAQRVLRNTAANLAVTFQSDEAPIDPDGNTATVTVTRADGTPVVTGGATTRVSAGVYQWTLPPQADLDDLDLAWTGTFAGVAQTVITEAEVVGGFYFTLAEMRELEPFSSAAAYSSARLTSARNWIEDLIEHHCGVAFVPRYRRVTLPGDGTVNLWVPDLMLRKLRSVSIGGQALTVGQLATIVPVGHGVLHRSDGAPFIRGMANVVVAYEHGYDAPPADVRRVALQLAARTYERGVGVTSERIGSYGVSYGSDGGLDALERSILDRYRMVVVA